ncbi:hypothetical protein CAEBREN_06785 [Caenorhabditis brenneri]|uniref:Uncharacterized protein n=1 Tax=Caenorhabditis brenneri TaxID=135651 RepID=G0MIK1_CAEBE|nr:hypothetical protein CAEBREN_06785 [Caenorhabditis brenneri]
MNLRTLCILFVIVGCFSIAFAKEYKDLTAEEPEAAEVREEFGDLLKDSNEEGNGNAKNAAPAGNFATVASIEEKKPVESATPAKGAYATGLFSIGALTMAAFYIA